VTVKGIISPTAPGLFNFSSNSDDDQYQPIDGDHPLQELVAYLSQLETGKRTGTTDVLSAIAKALDLSLEQVADTRRNRIKIGGHQVRLFVWSLFLWGQFMLAGFLWSAKVMQ
jgi:hypothetical protein